jgi:hypothetical protein
MGMATSTAGRVRLEVVEINPVIDEQERALLGVVLAHSGLGQKILWPPTFFRHECVRNRRISGARLANKKLSQGLTAFLQFALLCKIFSSEHTCMRLFRAVAAVCLFWPAMTTFLATHFPE